MSEPLPFDHGARLTVDLSAIVENWRRLAARGVAAETAAVVKADAYGCGLERVAPALAKAGARTFFVAHLSEGARLRRVVPEATIYILNGLPPGAAGRYGTERLRPVLGSGEEVAEWLGAMPAGAPAALHVDTGLSRLGLRPEEIGDIPAVFRPALLMSHFVASEEPLHPLNQNQRASLARVANVLPNVPVSLDNSSGIFLDEHVSGQALARPGYALYGGNPTPGSPNPMRAVVRLAARVAQVRAVKRGETIGYNATWTAPADRLIATVSLGYADGYPRTGSATNAKPGGRAVVNGVACPLVGRVSMDLLTIDVTDAGPVRRGDEAVMIGGGLAVDEVAETLGTNGYEVLTKLGARYERGYVGG
jgi:alanine racemase